MQFPTHLPRSSNNAPRTCIIAVIHSPSTPRCVPRLRSLPGARCGTFARTVALHPPPLRRHAACRSVLARATNVSTACTIPLSSSRITLAGHSWALRGMRSIVVFVGYRMCIVSLLPASTTTTHHSLVLLSHTRTYASQCSRIGTYSVSSYRTVEPCPLPSARLARPVARQ